MMEKVICNFDYKNFFEPPELASSPISIVDEIKKELPGRKETPLLDSPRSMN